MSEYTNRYAQNPVLQRLKRYFWIFVIVLPLVVMMIPSVIVNLFSVKPSIKNLSSVQTNLHNNEKKALEKPLITLGWLSGTGSTIQQLKNYQNLEVVSPDYASIDPQFHLKLNSQQPFINTIHQQGKKSWPRITMETDTKATNHAFLSNPIQLQQVIQALGQTAVQQHWEGSKFGY